MNRNKFTVKQFNELFPDDNACLDYMFKQAYGDMEACYNCGVIEPKYYRIRSKKVYSCKDCGNQISPLAGTIFHKSSTSLRDWFYAIYLFSVSKNGVSAVSLLVRINKFNVLRIIRDKSILEVHCLGCTIAGIDTGFNTIHFHF